MFAKDPLAEVGRKTGNLFKALATQPTAWSNGLSQYLGLGQIRGDLDPKLTMTVWWHDEGATEIKVFRSCTITAGGTRSTGGIEIAAITFCVCDDYSLDIRECAENSRPTELPHITPVFKTG